MTDTNEPLLELPNGAMYDREKGRIVQAPTTGLFTPETGRAASLKRWADQRQSFAEGFAEGIPAEKITAGKASAWRAVGRRIAEAIFSESKNPRGLAELVRVAGDMGGYVPSPLDIKTMPEEAPQAQAFYITPTIADQLAAMLSKIREAQNSDAIDAIVTEGDPKREKNFIELSEIVPSQTEREK